LIPEYFMSDFLLTATIAFAALAGIGLFINFCRRRLRSSRHGLSGMCHKSGGAVCSTCRKPSDTGTQNT
jgi:hypothetical protein